MTLASHFLEFRDKLHTKLFKIPLISLHIILNLDLFLILLIIKLNLY